MGNVELDSGEIENIRDAFHIVCEMCDKIDINNNAEGLTSQDAVKGALAFSLSILNGSVDEKEVPA